MKVLKALVGGWLVLVLVSGVLAVTTTPSADDQDPSTRQDVVSDLARLDMLDADQRMLQRMRVAEQPNMVTMIENEPMWVDPEMIELQEEYRAQLDRMMGRRSGQP